MLIAVMPTFHSLRNIVVVVIMTFVMVLPCTKKASAADLPALNRPFAGNTVTGKAAGTFSYATLIPAGTFSYATLIPAGTFSPATHIPAGTFSAARHIPTGKFNPSGTHVSVRDAGIAGLNTIPGQKSKTRARLYSLGFTAGPTLLSQAFSNDYRLSDQSVMSFTLLASGLLVGPSAGSIYAEDRSLARRSILIRSVSAATMASGYLMGEIAGNGDQNITDGIGLALQVTGGVFLAGHTLYDIIILSGHSVDYYNMMKRMEAGIRMGSGLQMEAMMQRESLMQRESMMQRESLMQMVPGMSMEPGTERPETRLSESVGYSRRNNIPPPMLVFRLNF